MLTYSRTAHSQDVAINSSEKTNIMEKLKLHSLGLDDHLKSLEEKFDGLRKTVEGNTNLTEREKQAELKNINERFVLQKRISKHNLY